MKQELVGVLNGAGAEEGEGEEEARFIEGYEGF